VVCPFQGKEINALSFLGPAPIVASASARGTVQLCDLSGARVALFAQDASIGSMVVTRDGKTLFTGDENGQIRRWDVASGSSQIFTGHTRYVRSLVLSDDERLLASGDDAGVVRVWSSTDGTPRLTLEGHRDRVTGVAFLDGDRVLASVSWDGSVRTWDAASGASLHVWPLGREHLRALVASPDRRRLLFSTHDGFARVCTLDDCPSISMAHDGSIYAAVFSPDGRRVLSVGADGAARLWDAASGRLLGERRGEDVLMDAHFSPDGAQAAMVGWHGATMVWRMDDGDQPPLTAANLPAWLEGLTTATVGAKGRLASGQGDAAR
jgi:hypothetical protein